MSMKNVKSKGICFLLLSLSFCWLCSCSEEIVVIEEVDRTKLDSLDNLISVTTEDLTAAKIAKDALQRRVDSLNTVLASANNPSANNPDVVYTVQVIDGSNSYIKGRTKSVSNAVVTVSQGNTSTQLTTGSTGMVTFPAMEDGIISVTVELENYADVYMIVDLRDNGADADAYNSSYRNASTQVMVFPTSGGNTFTVSGVGYYDQITTNFHTDSQNDPNHPFTGSAIYETVPSGSNFSITCVPASIPLNHTRPGKVLQVVYAGLERVATMGANGAYSVSLPVTLLTNGTSFFTYTGPRIVSVIKGAQQTATGNVDEVWQPGVFWPSSLGQMIIYPGGRVTTDVYYFLN